MSEVYQAAKKFYDIIRGILEKKPKIESYQQIPYLRELGKKILEISNETLDMMNNFIEIDPDDARNCQEKIENEWLDLDKHLEKLLREYRSGISSKKRYYLTLLGRKRRFRKPQKYGTDIGPSIDEVLDILDESYYTLSATEVSRKSDKNRRMMVATLDLCETAHFVRSTKGNRKLRIIRT